MTNTTTTADPYDTGCTYLGSASRACGCTTVYGKSYCAEHVFIVYKQGTARARRKKDEKVAAAVWDLEAEFNAAVEELIAEGYDFAEPTWDCAEELEAG
jgi:hypothetical protein